MFANTLPSILSNPTSSRIGNIQEYRLPVSEGNGYKIALRDRATGCYLRPAGHLAHDITPVAVNQDEYIFSPLGVVCKRLHDSSIARTDRSALSVGYLRCRLCFQPDNMVPDGA